VEFVSASTLIKRAHRERYGIASFCVWNAESCDAALNAASKLRAPVLLMASRTEFSMLSPRKLARVARTVASDYEVPAALHLDHGASIDEVKECLDAGFTSVMLDFSTRPFEENIAALRAVVEMARPYGASVEGELGHVGRADNDTSEGHGASALTDPATAGRFVRETGIDMLAVSIGNAHGHYSALPRLRFDLLAEIQKAAEIPLVLHGGSGTPPEDVQRAIQLGICKINVASDLCTAIRSSLQSQWTAPSWLPSTMGVAMAATAPVLERWITAVGSAGKA